MALQVTEAITPVLVLLQQPLAGQILAEGRAPAAGAVETAPSTPSPVVEAGPSPAAEVVESLLGVPPPVAEVVESLLAGPSPVAQPTEVRSVPVAPVASIHLCREVLLRSLS